MNFLKIQYFLNIGDAIIMNHLRNLKIFQRTYEYHSTILKNMNLHIFSPLFNNTIPLKASTITPINIDSYTPPPLLFKIRRKRCPLSRIMRLNFSALPLTISSFNEIKVKLLICLTLNVVPYEFN